MRIYKQTINIAVWGKIYNWGTAYHSIQVIIIIFTLEKHNWVATQRRENEAHGKILQIQSPM